MFEEFQLNNNIIYSIKQLKGNSLIHISKSIMSTITETPKFDKVKYNSEYFKNNTEHLKQRRIINYYKKKYSLTTDQQCEEFQANSKLYGFIVRNKSRFNPDIVFALLENEIIRKKTAG